MTQEQIAENKARFIDLCRSSIHREGLENLLAYLETTDFYTAPSSASFHLNEEGGLCRHSLNVFETAHTIYESVVRPAMQRDDTPFSGVINDESLAVATLFHDLCKIKLYHKTEKWKKDETGRWVSYPGYELKEDFPFGHGEKSCIIISWFMKLKKEELLAIRWHMGMFECGEYGSGTRMSYRNAMEKSPLVCLLQMADMLSANCLEATTTW